VHNNIEIWELCRHDDVRWVVLAARTVRDVAENWSEVWVVAANCGFLGPRRRPGLAKLS
jgi:hypothetical protein